MIASKCRQSLRFDILLVKHREVWIERTRPQLSEVLRAKGVWAQKFTPSAMPKPFAGSEGLIVDGDQW